MKFSVHKSVFMNVLTPAMGTVSNKNTITSIEGVLIETLESGLVQISTYDMNKGVRATFEPSEIEREGKFIINAQRLYQTVKVLPDDELTIDINDKLNGETAMRFIQDTHPVVIIDEPQSVDNTDNAKKAIASLNPLFVLRYSATHREKINLLYRLTPVDSYQMWLVKQISVLISLTLSCYRYPTKKDSKQKLKLTLRIKMALLPEKPFRLSPAMICI